ncbi:hypothetical protein [Devosia sp. 1635]|uniref:hypothetical protein n=1 Tax=Devosia sp. 1635 TaxID=2726066 RepID=UPI0020BDF4E3|nr:hypothetical protein [Devosia sp. 1635]
MGRIKGRSARLAPEQPSRGNEHGNENDRPGSFGTFRQYGMKLASAEISLQQSWDMSPELHVSYRERALVFLKVMGEQMLELAEAEISALDYQRGT